MSRHPEVKWAEREDKVYLTVQLADSKDAKVHLDPEGTFTFTAKGTGDNAYEVKLDLFDKVNVEESKINIGPRHIFCIVEKAEKAWWKKLLRGDKKPPHYVKVDWDKWVDEDDDSGPADLDTGGMDFSNFANMQGMGGMGGMGGMPGMEALGGMGGLGGLEGLGGLGGMGGMGGLGGMGGPEEFEDSDDEEGEGAKPEGQAADGAGASKAEPAAASEEKAAA